MVTGVKRLITSGPDSDTEDRGLANKKLGHCSHIPRVLKRNPHTAMIQVQLINFRCHPETKHAIIITFSAKVRSCIVLHQVP